MHIDLLRDRLAQAAMAVLVRPSADEPLCKQTDNTAKWAYAYADAMLQERDRR